MASFTEKCKDHRQGRCGDGAADGEHIESSCDCPRVLLLGECHVKGLALWEIWQRHLPASLPTEGVSLDNLADCSEGLAGRDVKTAVITAAVKAARSGSTVTQVHLMHAVEAIRESRRQKQATLEGVEA